MKFKKAIFLIVFLSLIAVLTITAPHKTQAQLSPCGTSVLQKATGLVATPKITGSFVTSSGACVVDPRAGFAPFKIPSYADLKSLYYNQSKANKVLIDAAANDATQANLNNAIQDTVYYISGTSPNGNLTLFDNPSTTTTPPPTLVVFVDGNLNFTSTGNYCYGTTCTNPVSGTSGTVFVVKGNVNIDPAVTRIDAVIIAGGTIYTAYTAGAGCTLPLPTTPGTNSRLVINGSLISLTDTSPPKFCRKLADNSIAAEKINHQVKYLVILRNLMSDTLQRWSEIP